MKKKKSLKSKDLNQFKNILKFKLLVNDVSIYISQVLMNDMEFIRK